MIQKTKVLTLIVFGLIFLNLSAQDDAFANDKEAKLPDENRTIRFGLQFNPNISWFKANSDGYKSGGSEIGFEYGLSFEYFISKNHLISTGVFMLNPGGNLNYKGVALNLSDSLVSADVENEYRLGYINIPLTLKLRTNEIGYFTYFGQFGINAAFNYRAKSEALYTYQETRKSFPSSYLDTRKDAKGDINFINMNLVIGGGIEYNISGNTSLMLGVTFNNGFINQLDLKQHELDNNGNSLIDNNGNAVFSEKDASANLNYLALNIGIYF